MRPPIPNASSHCLTALLLMGGLVLSGCSTWQSAGTSGHTVAAEDLATVLEAGVTWKGVLPAPENEEDLVEGRWHLLGDDAFAETVATGPRRPALIDPRAAPSAQTAPAAAPFTRPAPPPRTTPLLPVPRRRVTAPLPKRGTPTQKSPRERVRAHYLDHPTTVQATKITFYCPSAYLREVRLAAENVRVTSATRRIAQGGARLRCRELTLLAERITLRVREGAEAELQVTARGEVELVTRVRDNVTREEGLRSLILRQDQMTPLR